MYVLIKMRVKFFAIFCQSISRIFFLSTVWRLCIQMIEIALKYSLAVRCIFICLLISVVKLTLYHWFDTTAITNPPTVWPNLKFYLVLLRKNYFHHADLCIWTHLFYYLLFVLAKHIFKFCYRMSFPPCCISYILDHLWRNIILEMCMYF